MLDKSLFHKYNNKVPVEKQYIWDLSSAGRASALQAEGHRFEPYRSHFYGKNDNILTFIIDTTVIIYGEVAQLARACGSYPQCRRFKSVLRYLSRDCLMTVFFCFIRGKFVLLDKNKARDAKVRTKE